MLPFAAPLYAPQLLAFPYQAATPIGTVWSERPIPAAALDEASTTVRERMATTPLASPDERRDIFLTDRGWRWTWLSIGASQSFALTRPLTKAVVVNRTSPVGETVVNGREVGGRRALGSVLAHEFTHGLIRRRYGLLAAVSTPKWKVEGYCDHVAGESSITEQEAAQLEAAGEAHPALVYLRGRLRVEEELARNGGNVDALFAGD